MITAKEANDIATNSNTKHIDECLRIIFGIIKEESEVGNFKSEISFTSQECPTCCKSKIILNLVNLGYKVDSPPTMSNQVVFHVSWG